MLPPQLFDRRQPDLSGAVGDRRESRGAVLQPCWPILLMARALPKLGRHRRYLDHRPSKPRPHMRSFKMIIRSEISYAIMLSVLVAALAIVLWLGGG